MAEWMNIANMDSSHPEKKFHEDRYLFAGSVLGGKCVIDCACGMGYGSGIMQRAGAMVFGIDKDPNAIDIAVANYPACRFETKDIETETFEGFEAFVSFETLEHLDNPCLVLARLPGTISDVIISSPIRPTVGRNPWHRKDFTHASLCGLVEGAGFRIVTLFGQQWIDGNGDMYLVIHGKRGLWP